MSVDKRIAVKWVLCDGNAACVAEAPAYFDIDDNDELVVTSERVADGDLDDVRRAVAACPKHALTLEG